MGWKKTYCILFFCLMGVLGWSQAPDGTKEVTYANAHQLAFEGDFGAAMEILEELLSQNPSDTDTRILLARTQSWSGQFADARLHFNKILSAEKNLVPVWISAIKNELYAQENAVALGLANKALNHVADNEIERLKALAVGQIKNKKYPALGWYNSHEAKMAKKKKVAANEKRKKAEKKQEPKNRFAVNNTVTVFNERYDPMFFSNISYKRKTRFGSIIPRINYSSRVGKQGVQYDLDLYPKFAKGFYAYLNYGHSTATIFPKHKLGGDIYISLPGSFEFSAGGRYIVTNTRTVRGISNSFGHYRGNYYFSLRSLVTPKPDGFTRVSGNLLVRKYSKDSENYMGFTVGMGVSPELRQFFADDQLLAETIFFIETQRLNLEYQFTDKSNTNIYKLRLGVRRQEISLDSGNFFWGITAGVNYGIKF